MPKVKKKAAADTPSKVEPYFGMLGVSAEEIAAAKLVDSEKRLEDFLIRSGAMVDDMCSPRNDPQYYQNLRQQNYQNVESLLKQYRTIRATYEYYKEEFESRLGSVSDENCVDHKLLFEHLSKTLDVISVTEEKKFDRVWAPQITAGRRLERALLAVDMAMGILRSTNDEYYMLLNNAYISGTSVPSVKVQMAELGYTSPTLYYNKRRDAIRVLTRNIFGFETNKQELASILVYLRQQCDDEFFPIS